MYGGKRQLNRLAWRYVSHGGIVSNRAPPPPPPPPPTSHHPQHPTPPHPHPHPHNYPLFTPEPLRACLFHCLSRPQFLMVHFQTGKDIYCPKASGKFDNGGSASLNMHIMGHSMSRPLLAFGIPGLILQAKVTEFGTNVGLNKIFNITAGFYHR